MKIRCFSTMAFLSDGLASSTAKSQIIKLIDSYKVKSSIKFAMEALIILFNNLLICTVYKSPSQTNMQTIKTELKDFLTPYISRNYEFILLGDFKINLPENKTISKFLNNDF